MVEGVALGEFGDLGGEPAGANSAGSLKQLAMTSATRFSGGRASYLRTSRGPTRGRLTSANRTWSGRGRESGRAGEIRVSVLTSSGRAAASLTPTAPPSELAIRWTGPRPRRSISAAAVCANAAIE